MSEFFRRIQYLLNRRRRDEELASDMEFHREMAARHGGIPLGNALQLREQARDAWGWTWLERLGQDIRFAIRLLRKSPGFTLSAVLILAIGIGVNVAAFGFFNLMVLRPLPVRDPATLFRFQRTGGNNYASVLPYPEMAFLAEHATTLSAVMGVTTFRLTMEREEKPLEAHFVTTNYFTELGASASVGRLLDPTRDGAKSADPVVVLSHGLWERSFGSDPSIAGRTIRLNEKPATVLGVASEHFGGLNIGVADVWLPVTQAPYFIEGSKLLTDYSVEGVGMDVWGRLKPSSTPKAVEAELRSLAATLRPDHPKEIWENEKLPSEPGGYATSMINHSHHGSGTRDSNQAAQVGTLIGALVFLILAVACGNLGSLLLARGVAREREISIRVAVGAGKGRLVRQLFTESIVLGLLGSAAGVGLGFVVLRTAMIVNNVPSWLSPAPDWRVMLFATAIGFGAAIVFGLTPALQVVRQRHRATTTRQILIGAQVAASCVLLIVAGLLARALNRAANDLGFEYQEVVSIDPALGSHGYSAAKAHVYMETLLSRLRNVPGLESVSLGSMPPFGKRTVTVGFEINHHPVNMSDNLVAPQYFSTLRIPLLRGRALQPGDAHAVVMSQALVLQAWPGEDPLGKTFEMNQTNYTVIGIAGNARANQNQDLRAAYFLAGNADMPGLIALVKTMGPPESITPTIASIARAIDPKVLPEIRLMRTGYEQSLRGAEYSTVAVSLLALVALLLACLGIVGLVAYAVSQRTKEIGIRMALGARPSNIIGIVLLQFSRPVVAGLIAGVAGAVALSELLGSILVGLGDLDPLAYLGAVALFAATAALATLLPARRALRVDPMRALRND